ncbi:MAG TPA: sensor histidine kinase [Acidimicrobiales bacterium]|nr:sensor histidine kinase [Acidimicrobiales bacterium]
MAALAELARSIGLETPVIGHLVRLTASWGLLSDLSFSDLLLYVPSAPGDLSTFTILGQVRPTTSQTLYLDDEVGRQVPPAEVPLATRAWQLGEIIDGEASVQARGEIASVQCIPVRWKDSMVAVMLRAAAPLVGRRPGELERVYVEMFDGFARMITVGDFPFGAEETEVDEAPRVGDGVARLDGSARVDFASPNFVSALHRMGIHGNTQGARLGELGFDESPVRAAFAIGLPITQEIERRDVVVLLRCIPFLQHGRVTGAVVLLRDVSDLRRRDRLLVSKDATIREIHHRVKNNLQTISSLLRLHGRRLESPEAREALEESVRRIRSIALVHETLSAGASQEVDFGDIVRQLVRMVGEGIVSDDRPVRLVVEGDPGEVRAEVATPLAVVLTELLQNALEHAFPADGFAERPEEARVVVSLGNDGNELCVRVTDNGVGLPLDFDPDAPTLGLTIVRALVTTDLDGAIDMETDGGTVVEVRVPVEPSATALS